MSELQDKLNQWMKSLEDPKRRMQFFLLSIVILYFIWAFVFLNPLRAKTNALANQVQGLQSQLAETKNKIDTISGILKTDSIAKMVAEKQQIELKLKKLDQQLLNMRYVLISKQDWIKLKDEIINQQTNIDLNITLKSINDLPVQPWSPPTVDQADMAKIIPHPVYQHAIEVKFQSDYFSAIQYVSRLEKLRWPFYWDSLEYKVLTYPMAEISIKFHIFTQQPDMT